MQLINQDIENGMTIETAAKKHTIAKTTLWRHYKRHQMSNQQQQQQQQQNCVYVKSLVSNSNQNKQIFTDEEEIFLAEYIKTLAKLQYELDGNDIRKFVFLIAQKNNKIMPKTWLEHELADTEWLRDFVKRHPTTPTLVKTNDKIMSLSTTTNYQPKMDFNVIPNNLNDSISLYLFTQIYHLMKVTNAVTEKTANENK
ncbi:uncharacterized protein LOC119604890 isoform X1 [Lucilia sericata]|uniref:uncharacterized protein LOC119604890 isoform X1 n=1 Tax=Lucilia sericata TaxID=13632 RepID=UPI0018A82D80|nr:uncharacterized protein LOC119604890 isoform X1 [Lucilia sericata]XP_037813717.1 uncharacterized protein LOC119604890 isoform X1 [Lucilia sericata]